MGDGVCANCTSLVSVAIGNSVTTIGASAFEDCYSLTNVTIGNSVTSIGDGGFLGFFEGGAFQGCTNLTSVTVPDSVTFIGPYAFEDCYGLTNVTIANSVTEISDEAFAYCISLASAYFQGNAPSGFGEFVFADTAPAFSIYYPSTATGWTTPTWNGYPAQPYNYTPPEQRPMLSLIRGLGTVTPSFGSLQLGTSYQLQVSIDLNTWTKTGSAFTATSASEAYPQPFDVTGNGQLFFRLQLAP
jgi:hypothetical protein